MQKDIIVVIGMKVQIGPFCIYFIEDKVLGKTVLEVW
jgi:hypothetical protein